MADMMDQAQELNALHVENSIKRVLSPAHRGAMSRFTCNECGGRIPDARRDAVPGCVRCARCQELFERGRYGG